MKLLLYKPMGWRWLKMLLVEAVAGVVVAGVVATDFIVTVEVAAVAVYETAAHAVKVN